MKREEKEKVKIERNRYRNMRGATMAELLIVVGIILALAGVSFIAVWTYQRSLGQLERDGIAKEIFVAAQNHLTAAYGEGYLGVEEEDSLIGVEDSDGIRYFVVNGDIEEGSVLEQMLPFGSIDETVRAGGSYIIRYQKDTGLVLDVFYCTRSGSPERFNHDLSGEDYDDVLALKDTADSNHKADRRDWNDHILGWYGGAEAATLATLTLDPPTIKVTNAEKLTVEVKDTNSDKEGAMLKLIIEGLSSGAKKAITLSSTGDRVTKDSTNNTYTIVLDDVTTSGFHFAELGSDIDDTPFIPGENITIKAVAYSKSKLANIAYSGSSTTNSLFADISDADSDGTFETAGINNIRHLENLDQMVSNLGTAATTASKDLEKFSIAKAEQTADMDWEDFKTKTNAGSNGIYYSSAGTSTSYSATSTHTGAGNYYPVSPAYAIAIAYEGNSHSVSNIVASSADAGMFGVTSTVSSIANLELIDFSITGSTSAGALAGSLQNCAVTNVIAHNTSNATTVNISAPNAGGLIGVVSGGTVTASGAAEIVSGTATAGGLIGTVSGAPTITACFSGGHTSGGKYDDSNYNVTATGDAGKAGGLVGVADGATITHSYSTCSVSGSTGGGFVGSAGGTITACYCTGLVSGTADNAFIGDGSPTISGSHYYEIINEIVTTDTSGNVTAVEYKGSGSSSTGLTALDTSAADYNTFVGGDSSWKTANAYDAELRKYYAGKYCLQTVEQLGAIWPTDSPYSWTASTTATVIIPFVAAHYGDWPAPEIFVINESSN